MKQNAAKLYIITITGIKYNFHRNSIAATWTRALWILMEQNATELCIKTITGIEYNSHRNSIVPWGTNLRRNSIFSISSVAESEIESFFLDLLKFNFVADSSPRLWTLLLHCFIYYTDVTSALVSGTVACMAFPTTHVAVEERGAERWGRRIQARQRAFYSSRIRVANSWNRPREMYHKREEKIHRRFFFVSGKLESPDSIFGTTPVSCEYYAFIRWATREKRALNETPARL